MNRSLSVSCADAPLFGARLFSVLLATALIGTVAGPRDLAAGPYYYDGEGGGAGYEGGNPNGHAYVGGLLGVNLAQSAKVTVDYDGGDVNADLDSKLGFFGSLKLGWLFPDSGLVKMALEGEILYSDGSFAGDGDENGQYVEINGDFRSVNFMANGLLRFDLGAFEPYAGLGIGFAKAWVSGPEVAVGGKKADGLDVSDWGWSWQLIVGGELMMFSDRIGLFTEYKYLTVKSIQEIEEYKQHLLGLGVRVHF